MKSISLLASLLFAVIGFGLIHFFHPGDLALRETKPGHPNRFSQPFLDKGAYHFDGSFQSRSSMDELLIDSGSCLQSFTINEKTFRFKDGSHCMWQPARVSGLALERGKQYSYHTEVLNPEESITDFELFGVPSLLEQVLNGAGLGFVFFAALLFLWAYRKISTLEIVILQCAFLLRVVYVHKILPSENTWDFYAHRSYVEQILRGNLFPKANACWVCYYPRLPYWIAALWATALRPIYTSCLDFILQLHALTFSAILLLQLLFFVRLTVSNQKIRPWLLAALAFWPELVIKSSSFSNDLIVYSLWFLFAHLILMARSKMRSVNLVVSVAIAAIATKSNLLLAPIGFLIQKIKSLKSWRSPVALGIVLCSTWYLTIGTGTPIREKILYRFNPGLLQIVTEHKVDNSFSHIFGISLPLLFNKAYVDNGADETGRQFLSDWLIKSSVLSGLERVEERGPLLVALGRALISCSLILILCFFVSALRPTRSTNFEVQRFLEFQIWTSSLFIGGYRIFADYAVASDARYVLPAFLFMVIYCGNHFSAYPRLGIAARAWCGFFILTSVGYFLSLQQVS